MYELFGPQQCAQREDARATVLDEQMRSGRSRYPVDRYLVESSNKFEMVNIIDDEIWNAEPVLRPEDEIILRKLHEMLQSTADDLKLLSGELVKFHEPGVQVKTVPTPLDEEFNEKVHIEELVNAKFHGYKIIEKAPKMPEIKPRNDTIDGGNVNRTKILNTDVQVKASVAKRPVINRNLGISRTRIIQIDDRIQDSSKNEVLNNGKVINSAPTVAYNEYSYKYSEPKVKDSIKSFQVQDMPSINIRGELKEQKVLQLDIVPDNTTGKELLKTNKSNVSVVAVTHGVAIKQNPPKILHGSVKTQSTINNIQTVRKVSKITRSESSESTNNVSSDAKAQHNTQTRIASAMRNSPKISSRDRNKKNYPQRKELDKRQRFNVDEWRKKLNVVYGSSNTKKTKVTSKKVSPKKSNLSKKQPVLNNAEYIPYSQLTLGGVRVSDIEREISNLSNNTDLPLSPILDKILSSRENSFNRECTRKPEQKESPRILTTSDENLLQEVIDIERSVTETLSKNIKNKVNDPVTKLSDDGAEENESYVDDFEDVKSEHNINSENKTSASDNTSNKSSEKSYHNNREVASSDDERHDRLSPHAIPGPSHVKNQTFTVSSNLTLKDSVDIFEFIHSVDTQDIAIQSNGANKITPKETQTSPRNDKTCIQPIHNDLWPSVDPRREVEKMFELEKDFIKKLILEEYGDILEKTINKPTCSNDNKQEHRKNVAAAQKNTQTSPAHVKSVMTSPKLTKTRTTSPFLLSVPVHQQTSPMILVTNENEPNNTTHTVEADDISVNLSSPRFSLRLPQTSREVLSNLEHNHSYQKKSFKHNRSHRKTTTSSTSSAEADKSSSDMSSLGEIKIKRRLRMRNFSIPEDSSSSTQSSHELLSGGILPLRSEGEVSLGQANIIRLKRSFKSDGETSLGLSK